MEYNLESLKNLSMHKPSEDTDKVTPLHIAVKYSNIVELLINNGANVNTKNKDEATPGASTLGGKKRAKKNY